MHAARLRFLAAEFPLHEFLVIELLVRQIESAGGRSVGPAGLFIGTAFGTGFGLGWNVSAAIGAGGHGN